MADPIRRPGRADEDDAVTTLQLRFPFGSADPPLQGDALLTRGRATFVVYFVRMRRARRYILRVRPDGALRVTVPRGGSRARALHFAGRHLAWAERQRAMQRMVSAAPPACWTEGTAILLDGQPVTIRCRRDLAGGIAVAGPLAVPLRSPDEDARPALERAMRARARDMLVPHVLALAARHSLEVAGVSVRNQRSRWGSCSSRGHIALNYRLIQAPPEVREYILLHELMHLRQPNHSRRFWALVESVCPGFRAAERWLKTVGQGLF